jgi:hypothetical protein
MIKPAPCRCGAYPFPHRPAQQCAWWRQDSADARDAETLAADAERAYQQTMWDKDRADAVR